LVGAERGALTGVLAVLIGPAPMYALYLWRNWWLLPLDSWKILIAQALTYAVAAGALWGACVGATIGATAPGKMARLRRVGLRAPLGGLAGSAGCVLPAMIAADHFGQLGTPYFGGVEILLAAAGAILVASLRFTRTERRLPLAGALYSTLLPLPIIALLLFPLAVLLGTGLVSLELDALRLLADQLGLSTLGGIVGATLGGIAGLWVALAHVLPPASPPVEYMNI
jgi:hypothetical protein